MMTPTNAFASLGYPTESIVILFLPLRASRLLREMLTQVGRNGGGEVHTLPPLSGRKTQP